MPEFKDIKLPSGATLKVQPAPFAEAKALYQAVLEDLKAVAVGTKNELGSALKDVLCVGFSSPKIDAALNACLVRCIYNSGSGDFKIGKDTFEDIKAREDYVTVCMEVAEENLRPFLKGLMQAFAKLLSMIGNIQA